MGTSASLYLVKGRALPAAFHRDPRVKVGNRDSKSPRTGSNGDDAPKVSGVRPETLMHLALSPSKAIYEDQRWRCSVYNIVLVPTLTECAVTHSNLVPLLSIVQPSHEDGAVAGRDQLPETFSNPHERVLYTLEVRVPGARNGSQRQ